jgi:predicted porin
MGAVVASWSRADNDVGSPADRRFATLSYTHRLSRRTDVYAMLMSDRIQGNGSAISTGVGIRHGF